LEKAVILKIATSFMTTNQNDVQFGLYDVFLAMFQQFIEKFNATSLTFSKLLVLLGIFCSTPSKTLY